MITKYGRNFATDAELRRFEHNNPNFKNLPVYVGARDAVATMFREVNTRRATEETRRAAVAAGFRMGQALRLMTPEERAAFKLGIMAGLDAPQE